MLVSGAQQSSLEGPHHHDEHLTALRGQVSFVGEMTNPIDFLEVIKIGSIFDTPGTRPFTLGAVMPSQFERYVRILEPGFSDALNADVSWVDIAMRNSKIAHRLMQWEGITGGPEIQPADIPGLGKVHPMLTGHTSTEVLNSLVTTALAEYVEIRVSACIWDGWANDEPPAGESFRYRGRDYAKCSIVLRDLSDFDAEYGPVSLVWPAEQSWCIYNDIDTIDTFVGGPAEVIEAIKAVRGLEAFDAEASQAFDVTSDQMNIERG